MKYYLDGYLIEFSNELISFNDLAKDFKAIAREASENYNKNYIQNNKKLEDLLSNGIEQYIVIMKESAMRVVEKLIRNQIYHFDENILLEKHFHTKDSWLVFFEEIMTKYVEIANDKEITELYNRKVKEGRPKLIGGGFGLVGAAKGIFTASAVNGVTNIGYSVAEGFSNMTKKIEYSSKLNALFKREDTCDNFTKLVYENVFSLIDIFISIVNENKNEILYTTISSDNINRASIFIANIKKFELPEDEQKKLLIEALQLNPYNLDIYKELNRVFKDTEAIMQIANLFSVKICDTKNTVNSEISDSVLNCTDATNDNSYFESHSKEFMKMFREKNYSGMRELALKDNAFEDLFHSLLMGINGGKDYINIIENVCFNDPEIDKVDLMILSNCLRNGIHVAIDSENAKIITNRALELGSSVAMRAIGFSMLNGTNGYETNIELGINMLFEACNKGNLSAMRIVSDIYKTGKYGIVIDSEKSEQLEKSFKLYYSCIK